MALKMLFLPPQREQTREWARAVAEQVPGMQVVVAESAPDARREIVDADAAFGTLPADLLARAAKLMQLSDKEGQAAKHSGLRQP